MPRTNKKHAILAKVNFPLYTVQMLTSRLVLVGGGGGCSKTGVPNGFEIFELSHDGHKVVAEEVVRHETGPSVIMNCSSFLDNKHLFLVAGQESHSQLYNVQSIIIDDNISVENITYHQSLRLRKNKVRQSTEKNNKKFKLIIKLSDSVQTDFFDSEPLQRVVRISQPYKLMATGGTDGCVRIWQFPIMKLLHTLKGHKKEIDDLDFSPCENYLISIGKDGFAILWDFIKGKEITRLTWKQPEGCKYLYKRCRFGRIEGVPQKSALYMLANPVGVGHQKAYLQKWLPTEGILCKQTAIQENLSALAVRDDGRFIAVGTMFMGSVSIYVAFSLQRVLHVPSAHSMFVTGLEFIPVSLDKYPVTNSAEASVVSISVDNQILIHNLPFRKTIPLWLGMIIIVGILFLTFMLCSFIGI